LHFIHFLEYDKNVRRIVLFFVFFLSIFLFSKQSALAASCTFNINEPLLVGAKTINVSIDSGKTIVDDKYKIVFDGNSISLHTGSYESFSVSTEEFKSGTANFTKNFANSLYEGTFKILVYDKNQTSFFNPGLALCSSTNDFTVRAASLSNQCAVTVASGNSSTNDNVSFKVAFSNRNNDTRKVSLYRDGNEVTGALPNGCYAIADLEKGVSLGKLSAANYYIWIGDGCGLLPASKACASVTFPITATGGTGPIPTPQGLCYACPAGCTWNGTATTPSCKKSSSGTTCEVKNGYCSDPTPVCDLTHVFGCVAANGLPIGSSDVPLNPPFCAPSLSGGNTIYTCHTAIGDIVASPQGFIARIFGLILSISGGIALLLIIISGYKILSSQGNPEAIKGAREQLTAAIVGLLFIIFALVILQIIGFNILHIPGFGASDTGGSRILPGGRIIQ